MFCVGFMWQTTDFDLNDFVIKATTVDVDGKTSSATIELWDAAGKAKCVACCRVLTLTGNGIPARTWPPVSLVVTTALVNSFETLLITLSNQAGEQISAVCPTSTCKGAVPIATGISKLQP